MTISAVASSPVPAATSDGARAFVQTTSASAAPVPPVSGATGTNVSTQVPSAERVAQAVKQVNEAFNQNGQNLYASIEKDKATGINVVKVQDRNTKEVISQYPSKQIVAMAESIGQNQEAKGRLINVSA